MIEKEFTKLRTEIFSLYQQRKLEEALVLIEQAKVKYPDRLYQTSNWKMSVCAMLGRKEEALNELIDAVNQGIWWDPQLLKNDPAISSLSELDSFEKAIEKCKKLAEKDRQAVSPKLEVFGNPNADLAIYSFHWRSSNISNFAPYWLNDSHSQKYMFAFAQSSQLIGSNVHCWDDNEIAKRDILELYDRFKESHINNPKELILAGASQGGKLALELSLEQNRIESIGFISVIPYITDVAFFENLLKSNHKNVRGCIITGDQDLSYKQVLELMPMFEEYGVSCKLFVTEGLGHFFPDNFTDILQDAIDYTLDK